MKNIKVILPLAIIGTLVYGVVAYFMLPREYRWAINAIIEVPACTARVADRLGIESNFPAVKSYIVQSLQPGMTPEEVETTLSNVGTIQIRNSFIDEDQDTNMELLIELCDNPLGNVVLFVYYSKDGQLLNVVDAYEE